MDTLRSDVSSICYALVLRSVWAKEKGHNFFDFHPIKGLRLCPFLSSQGRLEMALVKQYGGRDPVSSGTRS